MAAIDFPASPTNGQTFAAANGTTYVFQSTPSPGVWVVSSFIIPAPAAIVRIQTFTANGTYTPHAAMVSGTIEGVGGGGGGGGAANSSTVASGSQGGGAGSYSCTPVLRAAVLPSQAVVIGAAGAAGTSAPAPGGNGGDTSVGTLMIAKGGGGGSSVNGVRASALVARWRGGDRDDHRSRSARVLGCQLGRGQ
jgi:hypothetical protein